MQIQVSDAPFQTLIFTVILVAILLVSIRRKKDGAFLSISLTNELKGLAILGIIFAHIGYYLSQNTQFLFPLSISAGMGVNLFLFLSGYGLTLSDLKRSLKPFEFYKKRLQRIFIPMWIAISFFLILDALVLGRTYPLIATIQHYLGFFPQADLFQNLDSPLWYFTMILFYYLSFPILFWKRLSYLSPALIYLFSVWLTRQNLYVNPGVLSLYKLHLVAFPLGMCLALLVSGKSGEYLQKITQPYQKFKAKFSIPALTLEILVIIPLIILFAYTSLNSGVGHGADIEQRISLITMLTLILIFALKRVRFFLLEIFGVYSYEIYLIHWPILYRYDFLYKFLPSALATILYLAIFLGLAYVFKKITEYPFKEALAKKRERWYPRS